MKDLLITTGRIPYLLVVKIGEELLMPNSLNS